MTLNRGFTYREKLGSNASGANLLEYLITHYRHSSEEDWQARIDAGRVRLNGSPAEQETLLRPGQTLTWHRPPWHEPEAPTSFAIVFLDTHLLGVAKPRGLPMMPGGGYALSPTHQLQDNSPTENVVAMYEAALAHGGY